MEQLVIFSLHWRWRQQLHRNISNYQSTRCHSPEGSTVSKRCKSLKSRTSTCVGPTVWTTVMRQDLTSKVDNWTAFYIKTQSVPRS